MKRTNKQPTRLTRDLLIEMIEEVMREAALCHDAATGEFAACETGAIYSLSHRAARQNKLDADLVGRGT